MRSFALIALGFVLGLTTATYMPYGSPRLEGNESGGVVYTGERTMYEAMVLAGEHCRRYRHYPVLTEVTPRTLGQVKFNCI